MLIYGIPAAVLGAQLTLAATLGARTFEGSSWPTILLIAGGSLSLVGGALGIAAIAARRDRALLIMLPIEFGALVLACRFVDLVAAHG